MTLEKKISKTLPGLGLQVTGDVMNWHYIQKWHQWGTKLIGQATDGSCFIFDKDYNAEKVTPEGQLNVLGDRAFGYKKGKVFLLDERWRATVAVVTNATNVMTCWQGRLVFALKNKTITVLDSNTYQRIHTTAPLHQNPLLKVHVHQKWLYSGSKDRICVWNEGAQCVMCLHGFAFADFVTHNDVLVAVTTNGTIIKRKTYMEGGR